MQSVELQFFRKKCGNAHYKALTNNTAYHRAVVICFHFVYSHQEKQLDSSILHIMPYAINSNHIQNVDVIFAL